MSLRGFENGRYAVGEANYLVAQAGDGPPLLLLHGFPETHACWHRIAPKLAETYRVIAPDLRGYGASRRHQGARVERATPSGRWPPSWPS